MVAGPFAETAGPLVKRVSGGKGNDPASACLERREGRPALRVMAPSYAWKPAGAGFLSFEAGLHHGWEDLSNDGS